MNKKRSIILVLFGLLTVSSIAFSRIIVDDKESFAEAAIEACEGKSVGLQCEVEFKGGSIGIGVCVEISGPAGVYLTCEIDFDEIDCKNNALGSTGSWLTFGSLGGLLLFLRRKKSLK